MRPRRDAAAVSAILLAAGASRRFGGQKLLAPFGESPLVRRAAERVLEADVVEVVVVLGHAAAAVRRALEPLPVRFTVNRRHASGLASSLRCGIRAVRDDAAAALVALADQPTIDPAVIERLIEVYRTGAAAIIAPSYRGFRGNPVLFDRSIFPELLNLSGDEGARRLVAEEPSRVRLIPIDAPPPQDVDTAADLARARELGGDRGRGRLDDGESGR